MGHAALDESFMDTVLDAAIPRDQVGLAEESVQRGFAAARHPSAVRTQVLLAKNRTALPCFDPAMDVVRNGLRDEDPTRLRGRLDPRRTVHVAPEDVHVYARALQRHLAELYAGPQPERVTGNRTVVELGVKLERPPHSAGWARKSRFIKDQLGDPFHQGGCFQRKQTSDGVAKYEYRARSRVDDGCYVLSLLL